MKLRKCYIAVMVLLLLTGCRSTENVDKIETVPISEAREQMASDMEELRRGDYQNLECDDFEPIFTDSDEWYTLHLTDKGEICELAGKELAQVMRDNYKEIERYFEGEPKQGMTKVWFCGSADEWYKEVYDEELLKKVEGGKYDGEGYFS